MSGSRSVYSDTIPVKLVIGDSYPIAGLEFICKFYAEMVDGFPIIDIIGLYPVTEESSTVQMLLDNDSVLTEIKYILEHRFTKYNNR